MVVKRQGSFLKHWIDVHQDDAVPEAGRKGFETTFTALLLMSALCLSFSVGLLYKVSGGGLDINVFRSLLCDPSEQTNSTWLDFRNFVVEAKKADQPKFDFNMEFGDKVLNITHVLFEQFAYKPDAPQTWKYDPKCDSAAALLAVDFPMVKMWSYIKLHPKVHHLAKAALMPETLAQFALAFFSISLFLAFYGMSMFSHYLVQATRRGLDTYTCFGWTMMTLSSISFGCGVIDFFIANGLAVAVTSPWEGFTGQITLITNIVFAMLACCGWCCMWPVFCCVCRGGYLELSEKRYQKVSTVSEDESPNIEPKVIQVQCNTQDIEIVGEGSQIESTTPTATTVGPNRLGPPEQEVAAEV